MEFLTCDPASLSPDTLLSLQESLTPSRRERVERYKRPQDRQRSLAAEYLVRQLLRRLGSTARLEQLPNGQPVLSDGSFVSLSHTDGLCAAAVSCRPVGIDCEKLRPVDLKLTRHVCTPEELSYILGSDPLPEGSCTDREKLMRFFEVWTGKEAWFKALGTGITDLKSVNILSLPRSFFCRDDYLIHIIEK